MTSSSPPGHPTRRWIGQPRDRLPTPALILDLARVQANVTEMATRMSGLPAALRPHAKIHKSPVLAKMQIDAGAIGVTTATVWEAAVMVDAGLSDVLVANQVVGPTKAAELARIAGRANVMVAVDSAANVAELATAARRVGSVVDLLVELDVGMHRCGVRSAGEARSLGAYAQDLAGVRLRGLLGYEGHCMLEPDRELRVAKAQAANAALIDAADEFDRAGLSTEVVAAGGLGTWDITGANPRITEIHAGSYIFNDAFHRRLVPGFAVALTVLATVTSRSAGMAVVDCGRKSIGIDRAPPEVVGAGGTIRQEHGEYSIHEEHIVLDLPAGSTLAVGDTLELMPGYSPTTVNLYDTYFVVADGVVIDTWPVCARYGGATAG